METKEIWRPVQGGEGRYLVSNYGRVRAMKHARRTFESFLKGHEQNGYHRFDLVLDGKKRRVYAHHLVAQAFLPPPRGPIGRRKDEWQINHKNGNKLDNRPSNLEWVSPKENSQHAHAMGMYANCDRRRNAKLTPAQVFDIKSKFRPHHYTARMLAEEYAVHQRTIDCILYGVTWKDIPFPE